MIINTLLRTAAVVLFIEHKIIFTQPVYIDVGTYLNYINLYFISKSFISSLRCDLYFSSNNIESSNNVLSDRNYQPGFFYLLGLL